MVTGKKIFVKLFALLVCLTFCVAVFVACFLNNQIKDVLCANALKNVPIYSVERQDKVVSISFDCAWGDEYTQIILEEMRKYNIKATFFMVSFWAEKYPDEVKSIIADGHEIGTHSKTHSYMSKQNSEEIDAELSYSCEVIERISGSKVQLFRPPYGDYDDLLLERASLKGLYTIQWDVDSLDWKNLSAKDIAFRVISKVKSGSIILCHNNGLHTAESLPLIFADLTEKGYKFLKISDLIYKTDYKMSVDGTQMKIN